jgi:tungstate transport system ATP-binding protein
MNRPADEFVAGFVGVETVLPGRVVRTSGSVITAAVAEGREIEAVGQVEVGTDVLCCIRPESVTLSISPVPSGTSARNVFSATIRQMTPLGLFHVSDWIAASIGGYVTASP